MVAVSSLQTFTDSASYQDKVQVSALGPHCPPWPLLVLLVRGALCTASLCPGTPPHLLPKGGILFISRTQLTQHLLCEFFPHPPAQLPDSDLYSHCCQIVLSFMFSRLGPSTISVFLESRSCVSVKTAAFRGLLSTHRHTRIRVSPK